MANKRGPKQGKAITKMSDIERARRMFELRLKGVSILAIATMFKVTPKTVHATLSRYTKQELLPYVEEYREMQLGRLDFLWEKLVNSGRLEKGDPAAFNAGVNILRRYADTVGSDAPTKIELNAHIDPREIELHDLILEAQNRANADIKAIRAGQPTDDSDIEEAEIVEDDEG